MVQQPPEEQRPVDDAGDRDAVATTAGSMRSFRVGGWSRALWVLLIILALAPRVIVSQPFLQNAYRTQLDEGYSIKEALAFGTGDLNPHRWVYPTLYPYLLAFTYGVVYVVGHLFGVYADLSHYAAQLFADPRVFMWAGRAISVVAGVAAVLAVRAIGARVFGPVAGWTAAFGLAVSPLHVKISAGAMPDALAILFAILAVGALCEAARRPMLRSYLLAGVFIGLGTGTKFWPVVLGIIGLGLHPILWWRRRERGRPPWRWLLAAAAVALVVFVLTSPYLFLDASHILAERAARFATSTQVRPPTEARVVAAAEIIPIMVRDGGWLWVIASAAGLIWTLVRRSASRLVVSASALLLVAVFAKSDIAPADYLLPAFPFLWMLAGAAVAAVGEAGGDSRWRPPMLAAALVVLAVPLIFGTRQAIAYSQTDTRTIGERLFHSIADEGDVVFVDFRSIQLENSREDALEAAGELEWFDGRPNGLEHRERIWDHYREYASGEWYQPPDRSYVVVAEDVLGLSSLPVYMIPFGPETPQSLDDFAAAGVEYIVFSEWMMMRHLEANLPLADFYREVTNGAELVGKVTPEDGIVTGPNDVRTGPSVAGVPRLGPTILIYRIPGAAADFDLTPLRRAG